MRALGTTVPAGIWCLCTTRPEDKRGGFAQLGSDDNVVALGTVVFSLIRTYIPFFAILGRQALACSQRLNVNQSNLISSTQPGTASRLLGAFELVLCI